MAKTLTQGTASSGCRSSISTATDEETRGEGDQTIEKKKKPERMRAMMITT